MTTLVDALMPQVEAATRFLRTDIVVRNPAAVFNPVDRSVARTPVTQTLKASPPVAVANLWHVPDARVQLGDFECFVMADDPGYSFAPVEGHEVSWNSANYTLVAVLPVWSGDEIAGWRLFMRGNK